MTAAAVRLVRNHNNVAEQPSGAVTPHVTHDRSLQMYLLTQELARDRIHQRRREADEHRLVRSAVLARRAKRKTAKAVLRNRVLALATR